MTYGPYDRGRRFGAAVVGPHLAVADQDGLVVLDPSTRRCIGFTEPVDGLGEPCPGPFFSTDGGGGLQDLTVTGTGLIAATARSAAGEATLRFYRLVI